MYYDNDRFAICLTLILLAHTCFSSANHWNYILPSSKTHNRKLSSDVFRRIFSLFNRSSVLSLNKSKKNKRGFPNNPYLYKTWEGYPNKSYWMDSSDRGTFSASDKIKWTSAHENNRKPNIFFPHDHGFTSDENHHYPNNHRYTNTEEFPMVESNFFLQTTAGIALVIAGKLIFVVLMLLIVFYLGEITAAGLELSPVVLPLALLPLGIVALIFISPFLPDTFPSEVTEVRMYQGSNRKIRKRNVIQPMQFVNDNYKSEFH